jgi:hypothetical protein
MKRTLATVCCSILAFGSFHLFYIGFVKYSADIDSSMGRSKAFKRCQFPYWMYMGTFWAILGILRSKSVGVGIFGIKWNPHESESRLFENVGIDHSEEIAGSEVVFDLTMAAFNFVPAGLVGCFKERIWGWLRRLFDRHQKMSQGTFLASLLNDTTEDAMTKMAKNKLRRIRWSVIEANPDLFSTQLAGTHDALALSERCEAGEIDFFISHSHADDAQAKFRELSALSERFIDQQGRAPFFWLDLACIQQTNVDEDLKCLPMFVMACDKVLVLHSPTIFTRLWCIWELYVCFAMFAMDIPERRIQILSLKPDDHDGGEWETPEEQLRNFDVKDSHCWDQDAENRIRRIIRASGVQNFNQTIRQVAGRLSGTLRVDWFGVPAGDIVHVERAGYLRKVVGVHHALTSRYFVAIERHLYSFLNRDKRRYRFCIALDLARVAASGIDSFCLQYDVSDDPSDTSSARSPLQQLTLFCECKAERDDWIAGLVNQGATLDERRGGA